MFCEGNYIKTDFWIDWSSNRHSLEVVLFLFHNQISEAEAIWSNSPEVPSSEYLAVYCLSSRKFLCIITIFPDDISGLFFEVTAHYSFQAAENFSTLSYLSTVCNLCS